MIGTSRCINSSTNGFWYFHADKLISEVQPYRAISQSTSLKLEALRAQKDDEHLSEKDLALIESSEAQ